MMTFTEIGAELGFTHQRAQQICHHALRKLARNPKTRELLAEYHREMRRIRDSRALRPDCEHTAAQLETDFKAFVEELDRAAR